MYMPMRARLIASYINGRDIVSMSEIQTTIESEPEKQPSPIARCKQCDSVLPAGARFCGICGKQLEEKKVRQSFPWLWPVIFVLSAGAAYLAMVVIPDTPVALVIIMWFLFVCPGMALVRLLRLNEPVMEWVLALALSFAIDGIIAGILVYAGVWSPTRTLVIVIGVCLAGALSEAVINQAPTMYPAAHPLPAWFNVRRARGRGFAVLLPVCCALLFVGAIAAAYTWSPVYTALSAKQAAQVQRKPITHTSTTPTAQHTPASTAPVVDAVIVIDNVNLISAYDPHSDRFAAAQLFVSLAPLGSHIGIVRITGSSTPKTLLNLQAINSSSERNAVEGKLSDKYFGAVATSPVAYFTPALRTAANMLGRFPASDRKYVILITDELAYSGDSNLCLASPDVYHNWFCEVNLLHEQKVPVVLLAFTSVGLGGSLAPEKQYIEARGGMVLPVTDSAKLKQSLTPVYNDLLKGIRPKV